MISLGEFIGYCEQYIIQLTVITFEEIRHLTTLF